MTIIMNDSLVTTIEDVKAFLNSSEKVEFRKGSTAEGYEWLRQLLVRLEYHRLKKPAKGLVKQYVAKLTGYSRAQTTRLIGEYVKTGRITLKTRSEKKYRFKKKYSAEDLKLVAKTALVHNRPNGPALKTLLQRADEIYGDTRFKVVKNISVAYLYVVMHTVAFKKIAGEFEKTKPTVERNIGERRAPQPNGRPGYLRVDSVHQGDQNGVKGLYHIDLVDEVTQWQVVIAVPEINQRYMAQALEQLFNLVPFTIKEIHSDNGSEYINQAVAELLTKLLAKLTKNRSRHCQDNALCEGKHNNVRRWLGYSFMAKNTFENVNRFYGAFNEYLNFHRPCLFPETAADPKKPGKMIKRYRQQNATTPFRKLLSLPNWEQYLKPGVTTEELLVKERKHTDLEMAEIVQKELATLFTVLVRGSAEVQPVMVSHGIVPARSGSSID